MIMIIVVIIVIAIRRVAWRNKKTVGSVFQTKLIIIPPIKRVIFCEATNCSCILHKSSFRYYCNTRLKRIYIVTIGVSIWFCSVFHSAVPQLSSVIKMIIICHHILTYRCLLFSSCGRRIEHYHIILSPPYYSETR